MMYHKSAGRLVVARPPGNLARIVRFVDAAALPPGIACSFDAPKNILRINREIYDMLSARDQLRLFRSQETVSFT
jgi:hypothetical protein